MTARRILFLISTGAFLFTMDGVAQTEPISTFFEEFTAEWVAGDPNLAVAKRYFSGDRQDRLERELTPETRAYQRERIALARRGLERLKKYDLTALGPDQQLAAAVFRWQLETIVDAEPYLDYLYPQSPGGRPYPLNQESGANFQLTRQFTVVHPMRTVRDAENFVARLEHFDERMNEATAEAVRRARLGIIPPRFILDATIDQMRRFMTPVAENPIVTSYAGKVTDIEGLDSEQASSMIAQVSTIVQDQVYPSWNAAIEELLRQLPMATDDAGLSRFEGGTGAYAFLLRHYTTTGLTADEIHRIGLAEVARIESEMDRLFGQIGMTEGTINERSEALRRRLGYPDTDAGREQIMSDIDAILKDALARADLLFDVKPRSPVVAEPYPRFLWESASARYNAPPLDGSRPGTFQMPLRPDRLTRFGLRSLVYHEAVPGHHFQIALAQENEQLPRFIQVRALGGISANTEGWALYAERLAAESGWYEGDIEGLIGQLYAALFRAKRLVVDTGLHARGWSRQEAIDYGIPVSEVERYVASPGQACSYMIGQLRIVALRERAQAALGDGFSIRDFHNVVLRAGSVPLSVLEAEVERYIAAGSDG